MILQNKLYDEFHDTLFVILRIVVCDVRDGPLDRPVGLVVCEVRSERPRNKPIYQIPGFVGKHF